MYILIYILVLYLIRKIVKDSKRKEVFSNIYLFCSGFLILVYMNIMSIEDLDIISVLESFLSSIYISVEIIGFKNKYNNITFYNALDSNIQIQIQLIFLIISFFFYKNIIILFFSVFVNNIKTQVEFFYYKFLDLVFKKNYTQRKYIIIGNGFEFLQLVNSLDKKSNRIYNLYCYKNLYDKINDKKKLVFKFISDYREIELHKIISENQKYSIYIINSDREENYNLTMMINSYIKKYDMYKNINLISDRVRNNENVKESDLEKSIEYIGTIKIYSLVENVIIRNETVANHYVENNFYSTESQLIDKIFKVKIDVEKFLTNPKNYISQWEKTNYDNWYYLNPFNAYDSMLRLSNLNIQNHSLEFSKVTKKSDDYKNVGYLGIFIGFSSIVEEIILNQYENSRFCYHDSKSDEIKFKACIFGTNEDDFNMFKNNLSTLNIELEFHYLNDIKLINREMLSIVNQIYICTGSDTKNNLSYNLIVNELYNHVGIRIMVFIINSVNEFSPNEFNVKNVEHFENYIKYEFSIYDVYLITLDNLYVEDVIMNRSDYNINIKYELNHIDDNKVLFNTKIEYTDSVKDKINKFKSITKSYTDKLFDYNLILDVFCKSILFDLISIKENEEHLETMLLLLSKYEHYRWKAFYSTRGWTTYVYSDTEYNYITNATDNKWRIMCKKHPYLNSIEEIKKVKLVEKSNARNSVVTRNNRFYSQLLSDLSILEGVI